MMTMIKSLPPITKRIFNSVSRYPPVKSVKELLRPGVTSAATLIVKHFVNGRLDGIYNEHPN